MKIELGADSNSIVSTYCDIPIEGNLILVKISMEDLEYYNKDTNKLYINLYMNDTVVSSTNYYHFKEMLATRTSAHPPGGYINLTPILLQFWI